MFARPGLPSFHYVRAGSCEEAVGLLARHGAAARPLLGGTDLFPALREGRLRPEVLVDVKHLPGLRAIRHEPGECLAVGAAATMNEIAGHRDVRAQAPLLAEAAAAVASHGLRNRATIGGNLCNASPCADTSPAALVLEARFRLCGPGGARAVPAGEFFLGPGQTALDAGEILTAVELPELPPWAAARYLKLGRCRSGDLSLVAVAALAYPAATPSGYEFRIGLGSVAPTPIRAAGAEAFLAAHPGGEGAFREAAELVMAAARPITDVRATAGYQRAMVRTLAYRALRDVWAQLGQGA